VNQLPLIIISGLSGSGKSSAAAALEDVGFFCVDNMPIDLLPKFLELPIRRDADLLGIAFVMDLRDKGFVSRYEAVLSGLRKKRFRFEILFLEAEETILVQRFSTTRRPFRIRPASSSLMARMSAACLNACTRSNPSRSAPL
jgi:UPF0042 nucleotide-binding protein